jgi:hypothetical protein
MVDFSGIGANTTPLGAQDQLLPESILQGKKLIKQLGKGKLPDDGEAASLALALSAIVSGTRGTELDKLWGRIEKSLNQGKSLSISSETNEGQIQAALGLFYNLINVVDQGSNTSLMTQVRSLFFETQKHVEERFYPQLEKTEKNKIKRIIRIASTRVTSIIKRMNQDVAKGIIPGPEITT